MAEKLVVPRLRVRRDWHKGLAADPINREPRDSAAHRDAQDGTLAADALGSGFAGAAQRGRRRVLAAGADAADGQPAAASHARRRLLQAPPCPAHLCGSPAAAAALAAGCKGSARAHAVCVCGGLRLCLPSRQSAWQGSRLCAELGATRMHGHLGGGSGLPPQTVSAQRALSLPAARRRHERAAAGQQAARACMRHARAVAQDAGGGADGSGSGHAGRKGAVDGGALGAALQSALAGRALGRGAGEVTATPLPVRGGLHIKQVGRLNVMTM